LYFPPIDLKMQVRRNSKEFKKVREIIDDLSSDKDLKKKIILYIVKAGQQLRKRIRIDSKLPDNKILFELQWDAVKYSLLDNSFRLFRSDQDPSLYYFKTMNDTEWDQNPFELKGEHKKELLNLIK
jgi:hypothetical protein